MKYRVFLFACVLALLSSNVYSQGWGLGIRLGDPSGVSLKKYMGGSALEFNIGRSYVFSGDGYYNDRFHNWYLKKKFPYNDFQYIGYSASVPIGMQLHYLVQRQLVPDADEELSGLDWYLGFGPQFRFQQYMYDYRYKVEGNKNWIYARGERVTDIDLGVDGVIGMEYTFAKIPLTFFVDINLFMEVFDDPFVFAGQAGLGARYRFGRSSQTADR